MRGADFLFPYHPDRKMKDAPRRPRQFATRPQTQTSKVRSRSSFYSREISMFFPGRPLPEGVRGFKKRS
jgi:hypothetical protein